MKNLKHVLLGTLTVGESATRTATTEAKYDYQITYTSSNPAVAINAANAGTNWKTGFDGVNPPTPSYVRAVLAF